MQQIEGGGDGATRVGGPPAHMWQTVDWKPNNEVAKKNKSPGTVRARRYKHTVGAAVEA